MEGSLYPSAKKASTIYFSEGRSVERYIGSGEYTHEVTGHGDGTLTWTSSRPEVASVNASTGTITLHDLGTTTIVVCKAETVEYEAAQNTFTLTVVPLEQSTIVFQDGTVVARHLGDGSYLNGVSGAGDGTLSYTSSNPAIATVEPESGMVTLHAVGSTRIGVSKAATLSHLAESDFYDLTVTQLIPSTVVFAQAGPVLKKVIDAPWINEVSGVGDGSVTYTSSNPTVAKVHSTSGSVTFLSVGKTVITANRATTDTHEGSSGSFTLYVGSDYTSSKVSNMVLRYVPAGSFQRNNKPADVSVITQPIRISEYEVTIKQFFDVMGFYPSGLTTISFTQAPAFQISWCQAITFCNKLSLLEGLQPVYSVKVGEVEVNWPV